MERSNLNGHDILTTIPFELTPQEASELVRALQVVGRVAPVLGMAAALPSMLALGQKLVDRCTMAGFTIGVDQGGNAVAVIRPLSGSALGSE